jgi:hypothetical protein
MTKCTTLFVPLMLGCAFLASAAGAAERPNILFFFADDWGRYASVYSNPESPSLNDVLKTPPAELSDRRMQIFRVTCRSFRASHTACPG